MNKLREKIRSIVQNDLKHSRSAMQWGGLLGFLAHPIYYLVWTYLLPQPYDNFYLRLSGSLICLPIFFQKYWSKRYESYLVAYWYFVLIYALPFVCTFLAIKNSFSTMWMTTEVMAIFVLALCIDLPLLVMACVVIGFSAAFVAVTFTSELPLLLSNTDQANLAVLPVVVLASMVFSHAMRKGRTRATIEKTKALTGLAGSIAHEMRNPLGHIKYAVDNITNSFARTVNNEQVISVDTVNKIYHHLTQISTAVHRGLQVIDITLREVADKPIDPANFAYLSATTITEKAMEEYSFDSVEEQNKVSLHVLNDFTFKVDETAYIYVVFNLIKNALYYFQSHPSATITITIDRQIITITDTGPGIPEHIIHNLFKNFSTADKSNGTGLGLAYCYRTMQAFGGRISCTSVVGQSTTFTLQFPTISQEEITAHTKQAIQQALPLFNNKRLLVVDDQTIYHALVRQMLEGLGCDIDCAENGQLAIDLLKAKHVDLIIMDLDMQVKNGFITTEEIRSGIVPHQKNVPIVAHTAESPYMAKIQTQKVGMDGFISKPCTQLELIKVLCNTLECVEQRRLFEQTANSLAGKTILIIDDELINRQYLEIYTKEWGLHALHADNGHTALDVLEKTPHVDIAFMDMDMPLMNGVETAQRIRANPIHKNLIIIALTGNFSEQSMAEAKAAGMNDFITKPFDKNVLRQKLIDLIKANDPQKQKQDFAKTAVREQHLAAHQHAIAITETCVDQHQEQSAESVSDAEIHALTDSASNCYFPLYQSQEGFFKHMPLIDYAQLISFQSGFNTRFHEFLHRFLNNLLERNEDLQRSFSNNDIKAILMALHSIVGATGYVGAHALHQYIKLRLYPAVHAGYLPDEEAWVETVNALVRETVEVLRTRHP